MTEQDVVTEYLARPYIREFVPDRDTGVYSARIAEFPGCFAEGVTFEDAYRNLEVAAASWIRGTLAQGQPVPEPLDGRRARRAADPMSGVEQAWRAHVTLYPGTRARRHSFDAGVAAGRAEAAAAGRVEPSRRS